MRGCALAALLCLGAAGLAAPAQAAPGWLLPAANLSAPGHSADHPQVALDAAGGAVAVWRRFDGANYRVQSATRPPGGPWGAPLDLSAAGRDAGSPQLAVDAAGDAVAVWSRFDGSKDVVQATSRPAGGAWGPPLDLTGGERSSDEPEVAIAPDGTAVAIWSRSTSPGFSIVESAAKPPGGAWSGAQGLSLSGRNDEPQLATDGAGEVFAVWRHYAAAPTVIQSSFRQAGGAWLTPPLELSESGGSADEPQLAVDAAGDAVAVWRRFNGSHYAIQAASRAAGASWTADGDLSAAGDDGSAPQVAIDAAGDAAGVWLRENGLYTVVQAANRPAGRSWAAARDISKDGGLDATPVVGYDASGDAVALWSHAEAAPSVVQSAESPAPAGGPWHPGPDLSEGGANALDPQIAFDPEGNRVAVWTRRNGGDDIVQAAGFDGAGPLFRVVSIPQAGSVTRPIAFSASAFDVWSPLASVDWSFGDGSGAAGISTSHAFAAVGTYPVTATATDARGLTRTVGASITIFPKASAGHYAKLRHGAALLRLHCPSTASCDGEVELIAGSAARRGSARRPLRRVSIGSSPFLIPPKARTTVPVPIGRAGRRLVRAAGRHGLKAQLTGPGVKHRLVVLLGPRRRAPRR